MLAGDKPTLSSAQVDSIFLLALRIVCRKLPGLVQMVPDLNRTMILIIVLMLMTMMMIMVMMLLRLRRSLSLPWIPGQMRRAAARLLGRVLL